MAWKWWEKPVKKLKEDPALYERAVAAQQAKKSGNLDDLWDMLLGGGGGSGGASYRPQTAEEAAALQAQAERDRAAAGLAGAQTADIPLARELARRMGLAEVGVQQAERAANPRRIFEAIYAQARLKPTEMAKGLQEKMNIPGFKEGKAVEGPVLARVGKDDDEYALLAPGSVVAPKPTDERPTAHNAISAILRQMHTGGVVSRPKARKMLRHDKVRGRALTTRQRGLFGLIAGGGTPTRLKSWTNTPEPKRFKSWVNSPEPLRLKKAQEGLSVWPEEFGLPQSVIDEMEALRKKATGAVLGATRKATAGTSLFDPMGAGGRFEPGQADYLRGLNLRHLRKLSPTQQQALFSTLSAGEIDPEDYVASKQRQFQGFNPVKTGTRARFAGILGR